jgi:hypothetical protein
MNNKAIMMKTKDDIRLTMKARRKQVSQERRRYTGKVIATKLTGGGAEQD